MDKRIQKKKHKEEKKTATDKPPNHNKNHPKAKAKTGMKKQNLNNNQQNTYNEKKNKIQAVKNENDIKKEEDIKIGKKEIKPENYIPYSCIPRLDDKQKDLSFAYTQVQDFIKTREKSIPLHKKSLNLYRDEYEIGQEYGVLSNIEDSKAYLDIFQTGYEYLDRYSDIKPYSHNTITINTKTKYINASPINIQKDKYFISTQGPKPETIEDFWTMVYDYKSNIIIMLCNVKEGGRRKCENYWETKMEKFEVKVEKEDKKDMYVIRTIKLKNLENKEERQVYQIHFTAWPDHGIPDTSDGKVFVAFREINKCVDKLNTNGNPIIVHCSAGVGRTGTFISMYFLEKEILYQIENKFDVIRINIFNLVRKLKEMRLYMVQAPVQYQFVYLFVQYLLDTINV